jgi:hypothetical protein
MGMLPPTGVCLLVWLSVLFLQSVRTFLIDSFFYRLPHSSSSSQRGGAAAQASRQTAPSPADAAQLELPDLGVEDVLMLQLQQLSLAQFTVATMEHAIPLLRTGRSERFFLPVCSFSLTM